MCAVISLILVHLLPKSKPSFYAIKRCITWYADISSPLITCTCITVRNDCVSSAWLIALSLLKTRFHVKTIPLIVYWLTILIYYTRHRLLEEKKYSLKVIHAILAAQEASQYWTHRTMPSSFRKVCQTYSECISVILTVFVHIKLEVNWKFE